MVHASEYTQISAVPWEREEAKVDAKTNAKFKVNNWYQKAQEGFENRKANFTWLDWLTLVLPCLRWMRTYNVREMLWGDVIAGISVAFMVVPQAVSYAGLAGLPAQYGLYGAFMPVIVYGLVGSSRQLAVGPVAITSLLISSGLSDIVDGISEVEDPNNPVGAEQEKLQQEYNLLAIQIAFLVACMYTSIGVLRLGFLTKFLSHSVISGFTTGAALTIGFSQLKGITGIEIDKTTKVFYVMARDYIRNIEMFQWREFVMGGTLLVILVTMKEASRRVPRLKWLRPLGPITACIVSILVVVIGRLYESELVAIVGEIPKGPPDFTIPRWLPMPRFKELLPLAVTVTLVDFLESQSIALALALKNGYEISINREIIGMGLANFSGAMFNSYTTTGSFSRSAVNNDVGAKSNLAGLITGTLVFMTLLFITPIFKYVPKNVLAAIIISSVAGLLDFKQSIFLFKVNKKDWAVWCASFLGTVFIGVEEGLAISIGLALLIVLAETAFPHTAELGRLPGTDVYRNVKQYEDAQYQEGMVLVRLDAAIYFANVQVFKLMVQKYLKRAKERAVDNGLEPVEYCILDMSPVSHLDAAGIHGLEEIISLLRKQGCKLIIVNPTAKVAAQMQRAQLDAHIGRQNFFVKMHDAVKYVQLLRNQAKSFSPEAAAELAAIPGGFSVVQHTAEQKELHAEPLQLEPNDLQLVGMQSLSLEAKSPKYAHLESREGSTIPLKAVSDAIESASTSENVTTPDASAASKKGKYN